MLTQARYRFIENNSTAVFDDPNRTAPNTYRGGMVD